MKIPRNRNFFLPLSYKYKKEKEVKRNEKKEIFSKARVIERLVQG